MSEISKVENIVQASQDTKHIVNAAEGAEDATKGTKNTIENIAGESEDIPKNSDGVKTKEGVSDTINKKADKAAEVAEQASKVPKSAVDNVAEAGEATRKFVGETADEAEDLEKAVEKATDEGALVNNVEKSQHRAMDILIEVKFKVKNKFKNNKVLKTEYERQLKGQEKGLNNLTVKEYLDNRAAYNDRKIKAKAEGKKNPTGRDPKASTQQKLVRDDAIKNKIKEYIKQGMTREEAEKKANSWIKTQAALHDPDQIAGGNPLNVTGMGDRRINSSIGSQWRTRADDVEKQVREYIQNNNLSPDDLGNIHLNIKLSY